MSLSKLEKEMNSNIAQSALICVTTASDVDGLHSHIKKYTFFDGTSLQICCTYNLPSQSSSRFSRLSFSHPCLVVFLTLETQSHGQDLGFNHNLCAAVDTTNTKAVAFSYTSDMMFAATTQFTTKPAC